MQRVTKYRTAIGALALFTVCAVTYAALVHSGFDEMRAEVARADARALASEKSIAQRDKAIDQLKADVSTRASAQTTLGLAVAAFSKQAEACEVLKQQFHVKD